MKCECGSTAIVATPSDYVCADCGLCLEPTLAFLNYDAEARLQPIRPEGTRIGWRRTPSYARSDWGRTRLRQYLAEAIRHLHLETTLGMSLFRGAEARALTHLPRMQSPHRKVKLPGLAMASLILAAQQLHLPLGIQDVIDAGHIRTPTVSRRAVYRLLCSMGYRHQPVQLERLLPRAVALAIHALERKGNGVDHDHLAARLLEQAKQLLHAHPDLRHHRPQPAAAALVYAAGRQLFGHGWIVQSGTWHGFAAEYTMRDLWSRVLRPIPTKEVPARR